MGGRANGKKPFVDASRATLCFAVRRPAGWVVALAACACAQLAFYEREWLDRPAACWGSTGLPTEVPYCQLAGKWAMELPEYNTSALRCYPRE